MSGKAKAHQEHHFEWFGPYGTIVLILGLPVAVCGLFYSCNEGGCLSTDLQYGPCSTFAHSVRFPPISSQPFFSLDGFLAYWGWLALVVLLHVVLPGDVQEGTLLKNGKKLKYKLNSLLCFMSLVSATIIGSFGLGVLPLGWIFDNFLPFATASIVTVIFIAIYLYVSSFRQGLLLAEEGNTGYHIYDFWLGRELNPRITVAGFTLDIKEFCELYPGLTLWVVLDIALAYKQYELHGYVSTSMILVNAFHFIYVLDAHLNEKSILTTMDITTDGFGFMLAFGDLTWVPFTYTLQARYLVTNPVELSTAMVVFIIVLEVVGLYGFRAANGQKDQFRRDPTHPSVAHLKAMPTKRGTKLLISGWWGLARHINYTADWTMAWSWCLPTGFGTPLTYFYVIYFGILLFHRDTRDDAACRKKYGEDWDKYCSIVKYKFFPGIY